MEPDSTDNDEIRRFEEQLRRNPDSLVFARLADACRKAGDPERALSILQQGIQRHPDYASAHIVRARALDDLDRRPDAEASLRRVLELDGQNLVAMRGLAGLAEQRGDPVEAVHWFEQIVAHDPANDEAASALDRLRKMLPETPPGLEPLPAPREEWWSSPAFEIVDEAGQSEAEPPERPPLPSDSEAEQEPEAALGGESPEPDAGSDDEAREPVESRSGTAWWFEDPAGSEQADDDGDLLTRTMAELYIKQGLVDEAAAIYRELLADRPDDEELRRALAELEAATDVDLDAESIPEAEVVEDEAEAIAEEGDEGGEAERAEARREEGRRGEEVAPTAAGEPADRYGSHPIPAAAAESEPFRDWIRRLGE